MPFAMRCPGCDTRFEFASDLEGKRIKCKNCGDVFRVERPVRKARDAEEDDQQPSRTRRVVQEDRPSSRSRRASLGNATRIRRAAIASATTTNRPQEENSSAADYRPDHWGVGLVAVVPSSSSSRRGTKEEAAAPVHDRRHRQGAAQVLPPGCDRAASGFLVVPDAATHSG